MTKWTPETVAYIREQYLIQRKSAGEIAKALDYAFSRNAITGKLFRTGALQERSGTDLPKGHGLPKAPPIRIPGRSKPVPKRPGKTPIDNPQQGTWQEKPVPSMPGEVRIVARAEALFAGPGVSLFEAMPAQCRWPVTSQHGVPHVCGQRKKRGAYCDHHAGLAYLSARRRQN